MGLPLHQCCGIGQTLYTQYWVPICKFFHLPLVQQTYRSAPNLSQWCLPSCLRAEDLIFTLNPPMNILIEVVYMHIYMHICCTMLWVIPLNNVFNSPTFFTKGRLMFFSFMRVSSFFLAAFLFKEKNISVLGNATLKQMVQLTFFSLRNNNKETAINTLI